MGGWLHTHARSGAASIFGFSPSSLTTRMETADRRFCSGQGAVGVETGNRYWTTRAKEWEGPGDWSGHGAKGEGGGCALSHLESPHEITGNVSRSSSSIHWYAAVDCGARCGWCRENAEKKVKREKEKAKKLKKSKKKIREIKLWRWALNYLW